MADHNATATQALPSITQSGTGLYNLNSVGLGATTQTLPSATQSGTGSYPLQEILVSTVNMSSTPFETTEEELISSLATDDAIALETTELLTDTASITDTPTFDVDILLEDTVTASESLLGSEWLTTISPSSFEATDTITHESTTSYTDVAKVWDSFVELSREVTLESSVTATESIDPGVIYNQLVADTATASDILITGQEEFITDSITITDTITPDLEATELLTDIASATDEQIWWALQTEELQATATGTESFNFEGSIYSEILSDTANIIDGIWAKDFGAIAWTMNTQSGGLTNYDNFGFNSIAFHDGVLYATSPEGLFELNADKDEGRDIAAHTKGGFLDFGSDNKKRVSDIFIGCTGNDIECEVETFDKQAYTYGMEYRDVDTPYNNRIKIGRGLSSRWWRFTLRNINGADFQIHDVAVQIGTSNRRL
jgi:hypothetical protein